MTSMDSRHLVERCAKGDDLKTLHNVYSDDGMLTFFYQPSASWFLYCDGVHILFKWPNATPLLNLDRPGMGSDTRVSAARELILEGYDNLGKPLSPISLTAMTRPSTINHMQQVLVAREGFECVFTAPLINDKSSGLHYYLSGYDDQEEPPLYFLTELPRGAMSVAAAREALKPQSVIDAEKDGKTVIRQGDMFAISTELSIEDIKRLGGKFTEVKEGYSIRRDAWGSPQRTDNTTGRRLYGSVHTASTVATLPDGTHLAKGHLLHRPSLERGSTRRRDHSDRELPGNLWYAIAKNMTPIDPPRR